MEKKKVVVFKGDKKLGESKVYKFEKIQELFTMANDELVEIIKKEYPEFEFSMVRVDSLGKYLSNHSTDWYATNKYEGKVQEVGYGRSYVLSTFCEKDINAPVNLINDNGECVTSLDDIELRIAGNDGYLLIPMTSQDHNYFMVRKTRRCFDKFTSRHIKFAQAEDGVAQKNPKAILDKIRKKFGGEDGLERFLKFQQDKHNYRFAIAYRKDGVSVEITDPKALESVDELERIYCKLSGLNPDNPVDREISRQLGLLDAGDMTINNEIIFGQDKMLLPDNIKEEVSKFEETYKSSVFGVLFTDHSEIGKMYTFLYVSSNQEDWAYCQPEQNGDKFYTMAYVYNATYPECSEFGSVELERRYGALVRTA